MKFKPMENITSDSKDWKSRTHKLVKWLAFWAILYVLTTALAAFGDFLWESKWLTMAAIVLSFGVGLTMLVVNIQHLEMLDEMMRKIQLEAMALALGVGIIGGLSYSLLDTENIISFDAEIGHLVILIGITYLIAMITGYRRYR